MASDTLHRIVMGVEYDGSSFHGWQKQKKVVSVQATLETAISKVAGETVETVCAGRTDRGVHAIAQVVHFDTHAQRLPYAWVAGTNTFLQRDIRVLWAVNASFEFDARRSATSRQYRYLIFNHLIRPGLFRKQLAWYYRKLDIQKMHEAAQYWIGEHDFSSFRAADCQSRSPIRRVSTIDIQRVGDIVTVDITANAFLHHMVRNMMGVLLQIGSGRATTQWAKQVLDAKDRRQASITAPASGLYLIDVNYPEHFGLPIGLSKNSGQELGQIVNLMNR